MSVKDEVMRKRFKAYADRKKRFGRNNILACVKVCRGCKFYEDLKFSGDFNFNMLCLKKLFIKFMESVIRLSPEEFEVLFVRGSGFVPSCFVAKRGVFTS